MKSRSLLINYCGYPSTPNAFMPDNGLAVLAGSLLKNGHETLILDYNTLDIMDLLPNEYGIRLRNLRQSPGDNAGELKSLYVSMERILEENLADKAREISRIIKQKKINFIAFKLWTGKSFVNTIKLAEKIKGLKPEIKVFAGGPHVDYFRERIYKATDVFDVLVYGEGEESIVGLAEYSIGKRELDSINNLLIKKDGEIIETPEKRITDLNDSFPIYDTSVYPALEGDKKLKVFISEFSRGCPNKCNFCGHSNKSGSSRRSKSPDRILEEFNYVAETHGSCVFRNGDSNTPGTLIKDVADKIIEREIPVEYALISHIASLTPECLSSLKRSGCFSLFVGIESGNQYVVDNVINKGLNLEKAVKIIKEARKHGLFVVTSYVYPTPGETERTRKDTFDFIMRSGANVATFCPPIVTPRSAWGDKPGNFGIKLDDDYFDQLMSFTPDLFYPPTEWKPLGYEINGKKFHEIAVESDNFARYVEEEGMKKCGIITQVMEDAALMARHCGMGFGEFRDSVRDYLTVGDKDLMGALLKRINSSVANLPDKRSTTAPSREDCRTVA